MFSFVKKESIRSRASTPYMLPTRMAWNKWRWSLIALHAGLSQCAEKIISFFNGHFERSTLSSAVGQEFLNTSKGQNFQKCVLITV